MGNIISAMLPSIFFVNFYRNNKKNKKWVVLYAKLLFISNIISIFIIYKYFNYVTTGGSTGALLLSTASAAALILFVFIMIITFVQMWANKKKVHY